MIDTIFFAMPVIISLFIFLYLYNSLKIAYEKRGKQAGKSSTSHSERAYRAFEFFFTVTIAIVGAIGYIRFNFMVGEQQILARQAMLGLAILHFFSTLMLIIAVTTHLGSKFERWNKRDTNPNEWWRWVEPWMIIFSYIISNFIWFIALKW